jgi:hypothetical protein
MKDNKIERRGEFVWVTYEKKLVKAFVAMVSDNGLSAIIMFDDMLGGFVGAMPIMFDEQTSEYVDVFQQKPLVVTPYPS